MRYISEFIIRIGRWSLCLLLLLAAISSFGANAYAAETGSITMNYPVSGAEFTIYRVGEWRSESGYVLDEPYASYNVNMDDSDAAKSLATYVIRDDASSDAITPIARVKSTSLNGGEDSIVEFSNLESGVYLIISEPVIKDGVRYISDPILVKLPAEDKDGNLEWDCIIEPKFDKKPVGEIDENLKVMKIWKSDDEAKRPKSVTVTLLRDGVEFEPEDDLLSEVELNGDNNWTYEWKNLDPMYMWSVVEKEVPKGYLISISTEQDVEVLTNTGKPGNPPDTPPNDNPPKERLPKTGQDWTPILMLVTAGLFFILVGLVTRRKHTS